MNIPGAKLFKRALEVPTIKEATKDMTEDEAIFHLCVCYNTISLALMSMERQKFRESQPMDALIAAVEMVRDGEMNLVEDEQGNVLAVPNKDRLLKPTDE